MVTPDTPTTLPMYSTVQKDNIPDLVDIATGSPQQLNTFSLVLTAIDIDHSIDSVNRSIQVNRDQAHTAQLQLNKYTEENKNWPPLPEQVWQPPFFYPQTTILLMGLLAVFYWHTGGWYPDNPWFETGAIDSRKILFENQWWRLVTALTLHADIVHLVGNCLIGANIILLLSRAVGYGLCWFMVLMAGAVGNWINIVVRDQPHLSVGFSTAVFAAIGILAGIRLRSGQKTSLKHYLLPLGAGAALLALLGSSGPSTDIGAHFFGFLSGILTGVVCNRQKLVRTAATNQVQYLLMLGSLLFLLVCWGTAWSHH
ncbi:rhomboid family intramembrane serine protease [Desulfogranum marinum]|uniref:rhomboid family intramembrane serine protease n=1 Tax=Desulfogranum marinum TaxID=453220 RepID=UPI001965F224|nr:rhomboid family intramembrane serine protease [Desulfogranum marinum]MBM9513667.1 rhomboid family intramembrane serine protease [Desulfogranum marinum]